jgi:transcriptional regulator with XRE-family HTH domain
MTTFAKFVHSRRLAAGLSVPDLARKAGITASYIWTIERAECGPPTDPILVRLATALDVPEDLIFVAAGRLPPSMRANIGEVVSLFRRAAKAPARQGSGKHDLIERPEKKARNFFEDEPSGPAAA